MKTCRNLFASMLVASAIAIPVSAGDINSTPTTPAPPPHAPCAAALARSTNPDCSGNEVTPGADFDPIALTIDLLCSLLPIYK
jgi:hypothetical protein